MRATVEPPETPSALWDVVVTDSSGQAYRIPGYSEAEAREVAKLFQSRKCDRLDWPIGIPEPNAGR